MSHEKPNIKFLFAQHVYVMERNFEGKKNTDRSSPLSRPFQTTKR